MHFAATGASACRRGLLQRGLKRADDRFGSIFALAETSAGRLLPRERTILRT